MLDAARALIPTVGQPSDREVAADMARESLVLLRNRKVQWESTGSGGAYGEVPALPLPPDKTVLVTGAAADSLRLLCGGWTGHWQGPVDDSITEFPHKSQSHGLDGGQQSVGDALKHIYSGGNVIVQPGMTLVHGQDTPDLSKMQSAMDSINNPEVDAIVLVFGEEVYSEKPGDIEDMELPQQFREYAETVIAQAGRQRRVPVIAVLVEGRPRLLRGCLDGADAVVWAGLPGPEGGGAIAQLLNGDFSPSGRLPISYPATDTGLGYGGQCLLRTICM
jgi:beta-glucosidase